MAEHRNVVSIHPYFKIHEGKEEQVKALLPAFIAKVEEEEAALYYDFTMNGDELFCREGYVGAEGALAHVENVGPELDQLFQLVEITRIEYMDRPLSWRSSRSPLENSTQPGGIIRVVSRVSCRGMEWILKMPPVGKSGSGFPRLERGPHR